MLEEEEEGKCSPSDAAQESVSETFRNLPATSQVLLLHTTSSYLHLLLSPNEVTGALAATEKVVLRQDEGELGGKKHPSTVL